MQRPGGVAMNRIACLCWLFIITCGREISSYSQNLDSTNLCKDEEKKVAITAIVDREAQVWFEKLFEGNGDLFCDVGMFQTQMSGWEGRIRWTKANIPYFKSLLKALNAFPALSTVYVVYKDVTIIIEPRSPGSGRIYVYGNDMGWCPPYDEILDRGSSLPCQNAWIWRGEDDDSKWIWPMLMNGKAIYITRIHLNPKYKVVYIFSEEPLSKKFEDLWKEKQAFEDIDYDIVSGQSKKTGIYKPTSESIRLLEEDFPLLEKGLLTEDFRLGAPK